jgi:hypothetical protein
MATDTLEFKLVMRPAKMNFAVEDAHRDDGKRFVVRSDEKLTAFMELESAICASSELTCQAGENLCKLGVAKRI